MTSPRNLFLHKAEYLRLKSILAVTQRDLQADLVLLIDRNGQQIAFEGPAADIDLTALASLAAANTAATQSMAQLVGEQDFSIIYHQGSNRSIHISDVARGFSLVLVFDESVSLGMVRLRVKRATAYLEEVLKGFMRKTAATPIARTDKGIGASPLNFTDEEIEVLFRYMQPKIQTIRD